MAFISLRNGGLIWRGERGQEIDAVTINYIWAGVRCPSLIAIDTI